MSDSMIKKVSLALAEADNAAATYDDLARAAIEAMREPTKAMVSAADDHDFPSFQGGNADPETHWGSMIDAALKP